MENRTWQQTSEFVVTTECPHCFLFWCSSLTACLQWPGLLLFLDRMPCQNHCFLIQITVWQHFGWIDGGDLLLLHEKKMGFLLKVMSFTRTVMQNRHLCTLIKLKQRTWEEWDFRLSKGKKYAPSNLNFCHLEQCLSLHHTQCVLRVCSGVCPSITPRVCPPITPSSECAHPSHPDNSELSPVRSHRVPQPQIPSCPHQAGSAPKLSHCKPTKLGPCF